MRIKTLTRAFISLSLLLLLFMLGAASYAYYRLNNWEDIASYDNMKANAENLGNRDLFTRNFYRVFDSLYPKARETSMLRQTAGQVWHSLGLSHSRPDCKCDEIGYIAWNNPQFTWILNQSALMGRGGYLRFGFALNEFVNAEQCFNYWINHGFYYRTENRYFTSLNEFSNLYFHKNIGSLNDEQLILLIAFRKQESYPILNTERFEKTLSNLRNDYHKILP